VSKLLSGSGLSIALECAWAYHQNSKYPDAIRDDAAEDGTRVHEVIATKLTPGAESRPLRPELACKAARALEWLEREGIAVVGVERAFAYRPSDRSARVLGDNIGREYEAHGLDAQNEIPLTVDLVGRRRDGTYVVVDWKNDALQYNIEPASESLQLGLGAYCVAKVTHARTVDGVYAFVGADDVATDTETFNGMNFLRVLGRTEQAWTNSKRSLAPVEGSHCRYCPALGACPKTKERLGELSEDKSIVWTTEYVSDENDVKMILAVTAMEKSIEAIRTALKQRAEAKGGVINLGNGKAWTKIVVQTKGFNKRKAEELLGERISECITTTEQERFVQKKVKE
jgi:hypothetical protein